MINSARYLRLLPAGILAIVLLGVLWVAAVSAESPPLTSATNAPPTSTAQYQLVFSSTWSATTHPHATFPTSSAHYSPLAGATHNSAYSIWSSGGLASAGVKKVAEVGDNSVLLADINTQIAAGTVISPLAGSFQWAYDAVTVTFSADTAHPYVSFVSMIAPSPDWFVGVDSLSLQDASGNWLNTITLDAYPYDAGTEDGVGYGLSNPATVPQQAITSIAGQHVFSAQPLGTFTLTRTDLLLNETVYLPILLKP